MDTNQIVLGIVLVGIIIIAGITVYNQFVPSQTITQIGESTTSINAEVAKLIISLSALTKTTNTINTSLTKFIQDSQDYYASNTNAIAAINDLIASLQSSVFSKDDLVKLLIAVNDKLKKSGTFVGSSRGYFAVTDTAEQIATTVSSIQGNLASNTENYLIRSQLLDSYINNEITTNPNISQINTNIDTARSDLNKMISNLDIYLTKLGSSIATLPTNISTFCYMYADNPKRALFYKPKDGVCIPRWGWGINDPTVGSGDNLIGFTTAQPGTNKYCYKYWRGTNGYTSTIFYKPINDNCETGFSGWTHSSENISPGEVYLYPSPRLGTQKFCYRYADGAPPNTMMYRANPDGSCPTVPGFNYTFTGDYASLGNGGEVWAPVI